MQTTGLSSEALDLLRRYVESGDIPVDDSNRATCRELAAAGLMVAGHTFTGGREVFYRCTEAGWSGGLRLIRQFYHEPAGTDLG